MKELFDLEKINIGGEKRLKITLKNVKIGKYANNVLIANKCSELLDMRTVFDHDSVEIFYLADELDTLDEWVRFKMNCGTDVFCAAIDILYAIKQCGEYLISPRELPLIPDKIFYDFQDHKVKFMYIPGYENRISVREALATLIDLQISQSENPEQVNDILITYKKNLYYHDYSINDFIKLTEESLRNCRFAEDEANKIIDISQSGTTENVNDSSKQRFIENSKTKLRKTKEEYLPKQGFSGKIKNLFTELVS